MSPDEPVTLGEVARRINRLEEQTTKDFVRLEEQATREFAALHIRISTMDHVPLALYTSERNSMREEIASAVRLAWWAIGLISSTVIGAIIVSILAAGGILSK